MVVSGPGHAAALVLTGSAVVSAGVAWRSATAHLAVALIQAAYRRV
jgi:hypothetical protein